MSWNPPLGWKVVQHDGQLIGRVIWSGQMSFDWQMGSNVRALIEKDLHLPLQMVVQISKQQFGAVKDELLGETINNVMEGIAASSQGFARGVLIPADQLDLERRFAAASAADGSASGGEGGAGGYRTNKLPADTSPANLLRLTTAGEIVWAPSNKALPGHKHYKAGGSWPQGQTVWVNVAGDGKKFSLTVVVDMQPQQPIEQKSGLFGKCQLAKLVEAIESSSEI